MTKMPDSSQRRGWPLNLILSAQIIFVTLLPMMIVAVLFLTIFTPTLREDLERSHLALSRAIASQVQAQLTNAATDMDLLLSLMQSTPSNREVTKLLDTFASNQNFYEALYWTDLQGLVQTVGLPVDKQFLRSNYVGLDMSRKRFFPRARDTMSKVWSGTFLSAVGGRLSVARVIPTSQGILIGEIAVDQLPMITANIASKHQMTVMIIDQYGQLIAHPDAGLSQQQLNLTHLELVSRGLTGEVLSLPFTFDQQRLFGSGITVKDPAWLVIASQLEVTINQEQNTLIAILFITIFLGLLGAFIVSSFITRAIGHRFQVYTEQAKRLADGNYRLPKPQYSRIREFQGLGEDLVTTGKAIEQREQKILQLNADLEARVARRTDDLQHSNKELQSALRNLTHTQSELVRSEKLAALGSLVAGVAHELNTPIGNSLVAASSIKDQNKKVKSLAEDGVLKKSDFDRFLDDCEQGMEIVDRNLKRASELIKSFKQVAVDRSSSQKRVFELNQLIDEVLLTLHPQLKKSVAAINLDIDTQIYMESYPGAIGQVLTNLLQNAVVHAFEGLYTGEISISAKCRNDDTIQLIVKDNGVGIAKDAISKIFDPFFTTKMGQGGSGLGLNIVHNTVQNVLKGSISVKSEPQKGTEFTVIIPREMDDPSHEAQ